MIHYVDCGIRVVEICVTAAAVFRSPLIVFSCNPSVIILMQGINRAGEDNVLGADRIQTQRRMFFFHLYANLYSKRSRPW